MIKVELSLSFPYLHFILCQTPSYCWTQVVIPLASHSGFLAHNFMHQQGEHNTLTTEVPLSLSIAFMINDHNFPT